jgi:hypothetical protein
MLCKFKGLFGNVNEGVHSIRLFDIAVVDVASTVLGAYIFWSYYPRYHFSLVLAFFFILGIISHRIFCVRTTIDKLLF